MQDLKRPGEFLSAAQLQAILHELPSGVIVAEAPSGKMLAYNRAAESLWTLPPPLAGSVEEYSMSYPGYHPDGRPYTAEEWPLTRALRQGERVEGEEIEIVRGDGERRVFRISAAPVRDAEGRIVAGVITADDVTDARRHLERERFLGEASEILSGSLDFEGTVQGIAELCVRSLAGYCLVHAVEGGEARALGIAHSTPVPTEVVREVLRRFPVPIQGPHPVAEVLRSGEPILLPEVTAELIGEISPDPEGAALADRVGVASGLVVPLKAAGRTLGALTLGRTAAAPPFGPDDLELAVELARRVAHAVDNGRLYRQARAAVRAREEMMSVVSHDLRNALHAALMNLDVVLDFSPVLEAEGKERRQLGGIRRSLEHMYRLVQDLQEADRIERGSLSIHPARLDPHRFAQEIEETVGSVVRDAGVRLEIEITEETPAVLADAERVTQVLTNLIQNALHATPAGGSIRLGAAPDGGNRVVFRVTDTGAGIPADQLDRIFDRFYQGPTARPGGAGLGLTIARGIVEAHGGRIWAESRPSEGSTFSFSLPAA